MRKPPRYYVLITYQGCKVRKPAWTLAQAIRIAESAQSDALRPERAVVLRHGIVPEFSFGWSGDDPSTATWTRNITI